VQSVDRGQILRYRAGGHNLGVRLPESNMVAAAGAIGIRDVRGSGLLSMHARVANVGAGDLDEARRGGGLIDVTGARGVDTLVPAEDFVMFTLGTLPSDDESLRMRLKPFLPDLNRSGLTAPEALALAKSVARQALASGPLDIGALSGALTAALPELSPMCRGRCGVAHIEQLLFDLVGESGVWRHDRVDSARVYVAMDEPSGAEAARAELVRRYLRCYGPSTARHFADWCGISVTDAARSLGTAEVIEVGEGVFVSADDQSRFDAPAPIAGVRILPPRDPYLLDRDRTTLVPDREIQKRLWRAIPTDGVVLADGDPVATWRPQTTGTRLRLDIQPFAPLGRATIAELEEEAGAIAALRGCTSAELSL
jgi:hypothetical protein